DHLVDVGDGVGVADPGDAEVLLAHPTRALDLDGDLPLDRHEPLAGDPGRALVVLLVDAVGHVEHAAGDVLVVGVGALVHGVARDAGDGAALPRGHGGHLDV